MGRPRTPGGRARETDRRLEELFPGSARELCALSFASPFQLLTATILSAQCTDERVNMVTANLFPEIPTPAALMAMPRETLEEIIRPTGFFHNKATSLLGMAAALEERHGGEVPKEMAALVDLPGVGRKTANVVRSVAFGLPGLPVDTHVGRISRLLRLTAEDDPVKVESDLCAELARNRWGGFSLRVILHGRATCIARRPRCGECVLADFCPSAGA